MPSSTTFAQSMEEETFAGVFNKSEILSEELVFNAQNEDRADADSDHNAVLYIGLGGTGLNSVDRLKKIMAENNDGIVPKGIGFLGFDCDKDEVKSCKFLQPNVEALALTVPNPKETYSLHKNEEFFNWMTQKKLPTDGEFGAAQYRQVSRMLFFKHQELFYKAISEKINRILPEVPAQATGIIHLDVYIISSLCGGAGSGMFIDAAANLRYFAKNFGNFELSLFGVFVTGDVYQRFPKIPTRQHSRLLANTYACIKDLQFFQDDNSEHIVDVDRPFNIIYPNDVSLNINQKLFDLVLLIQGSNRTGLPTIQSAAQLRNFIANAVYLFSFTPVNINDRRSKWINPGSGFNLTKKHKEGSPKAFCSIGYSRLRYPEIELINYLNGYFGEKLLSNYLDITFVNTALLEKYLNISSEKFSENPEIISNNDYMKLIAAEELDNGLEFDDIYANFVSGLTALDFNEDEIESQISTIIDGEDWEDIRSKLNENENAKKQQLANIENILTNLKKEFFNGFDAYINRLPEKFVGMRIGVSHIKSFFNNLQIELDDEEIEANYKLLKIDSLAQNAASRLQDEKSIMNIIIDDKPFLRPKAKLKEEAGGYIDALQEFLKHQRQSLIIKNILDVYRDLDVIINDRTRKIDKIIPKLESVRSNYSAFKTEYRNILKRILGSKSATDNLMEFSILTPDNVEEFRKEFLEKNPINNQIKSLFADEFGKFWSFYNKKMKDADIFEIIQNRIEELFGVYRKSLSDVVEDLNIEENELKEKLAEINAKTSAQWSIDRNYFADIETTSTFGYPENLKLEVDAPNSISDKQIDLLKVEYGVPAQMIIQMKIWGKYYQLENNDPDNPNTLHIFPQSSLWSEADSFPANEDSLLLFALGLAFNKSIEITDEERAAISSQYKKNVGNYISQIGNNFYLTPYYSKELAKEPSKMESDLYSLGLGRENAFKEFRSKKIYSQQIIEWIKGRIMPMDLESVINDLKNYINGTLLEDKRTAQTGLGIQIENEIKVLNEYVDIVQKQKSFFTP